MDNPAKIVANGAFTGHPVEGFKPIWHCAAMRIARSAWVDAGLEVFLRMEVPYSATSSGRLSDDAVQLLLKTATPDHPFRFLEIGAGSGLFAKLFLDRLADLAPEIYRDCRYTVTDGNAKMLQSQADYGILAAHKDHIETRVLDAAADWPPSFQHGFDGIFGSYILDSLPAEFLITGPDGPPRRMEARCTVQNPDEAADLKAALKTPGDAHLSQFLALNKRLNIQTRHQPVTALAFADAIEPQAEDTPMVHCTGALACMENIAKALRPGGIAVLSDYGSLAPRDPSETVEFQSFGASAAHAVNFHQLDRYFADHPVSYLKPEAEEGSLITRVFYNGAGKDLFDLVDLLFGVVRQRALRLPVDAAREMLRANAFQAARGLYLKAMALQPYNWALVEEVAELLLLREGAFADARALAKTGLALNPYAPGLHRICAEACYELGDIEGAKAAMKTCLKYAGDTPQARLLQAQILAKSGEPEPALIAIAQGLAADTEAEQREALIMLQEEVLLTISRTARDDLLAEVNRVCALDGLPR